MKKADFIVIGTVLAVVGVLVLFLYFINGDSGKYVQVEVDGEIVETVELSKDFEKEYVFDGESNKLVVKDGKAMVTYANCKDLICVNHMPIHRTGESIICLPHKFVVTVLDSYEAEPEIDAVA